MRPPAIAAPSPKFASEAELVALGSEAASVIIRTVLDVAPGGTKKSQRLLDRTRRVLKEMMPHSGSMIYRTMLDKISEGDAEALSRLITYITTDIADKGIVNTYLNLIETGRFPELTMKIVVDLSEKHQERYSIPPCD